MRVYIDGLLDGELDDASLIDWSDLPEIFPPGQVNYPSPAQLYVGADKHNQLGSGATVPDFDFYEGRIDEAQVWNRALTGGEIAFYRRISLTGLEPGLIHYWKFDEGNGATALDEATHQADLTLFPGASWVVSTAPVNVTGVDPSLVETVGARLRAFPNPMRGRATILLESGSSESSRVRSTTSPADASPILARVPCRKRAASFSGTAPGYGRPCGREQHLPGSRGARERAAHDPPPSFCAEI
jgi:hypothetical protein